MSIQRDRGNRHERAVAKRLGTQRTGQYGGVDVATEGLSAECKSRDSYPKWFTEALAQAKKYAKPGQCPIVVFHETGKRHDDDVVAIRMKDFEAWWGEVDEA